MGVPEQEHPLESEERAAVRCQDPFHAGRPYRWSAPSATASSMLADDVPRRAGMTRLAPAPALVVAAALASLLSAPAGGRARAALADLRGRTIAVDPGHDGGNGSHAREIGRLVNAGTLWKPCDTAGTETASGYTEAAFAFDVALRLRAILEEAGAHVVLTRRTNRGVGPCITERAAIGNRARADAAISIHADGGPASGRGFHVIYPPSIRGLTDDIAAASRRLALAVRAAYRAGTGLPYASYVGRQGLDVRSDLGGLNLSNVPKVFVEAANMRNPIDAALLERLSFRQRIARALAAGLARYLTGRR